jgi:hypothetical protein
MLSDVGVEVQTIKLPSGRYLVDVGMNDPALLANLSDRLKQAIPDENTRAAYVKAITSRDVHSQIAEKTGRFEEKVTEVTGWNYDAAVLRQYSFLDRGLHYAEKELKHLLEVENEFQRALLAPLDTLPDAERQAYERDYAILTWQITSIEQALKVGKSAFQSLQEYSDGLGEQLRLVVKNRGKPEIAMWSVDDRIDWAALQYQNQERDRKTTQETHLFLDSIAAYDKAKGKQNWLRKVQD